MIVLQWPPGRWIRSLQVPTILMSAFWASDNRYPLELGSIWAPTLVAISCLITSTVAPVSGVTRSEAILTPLPWQPAIIFRGTRGVGAPIRARMSGSMPPPFSVSDDLLDDPDLTSGAGSQVGWRAGCQTEVARALCRVSPQTDEHTSPSLLWLPLLPGVVERPVSPIDIRGEFRVTSGEYPLD